MTEPRVVIGRLGRPHGVRGAVRARPTGPTLASLPPGAEVEVRLPAGESRAMVLAEREGPPERPILRFSGVASREAAAALTGGTIAVAEGRVPPLEDPDTFYVRDLIGFRVLVGDRPAGAVAAVHPLPANDVLEVAGAGEPLLVPFTADAIRELDVAARRIVVRPDLLPPD